MSIITRVIKKKMKQITIMIIMIILIASEATVHLYDGVHMSSHDDFKRGNIYFDSNCEAKNVLLVSL